MKACVIGAGVITDLCHLAGYVSGGVEISGIADLDPLRAQDKADRYPIKKVYVDWREMLETEKPDTVSVCLPNMLHEEPVIAALEMGAHVLCEKPLAPTVAAAERMFAAARRTGRHLMAAQQFRWSAGALAVKPLLDSGDLGDIYFAETDWLRASQIPKRYGFHSRAMSGGGPLIDLGVHALDLTLWLMGSPTPTHVSAMTTRAFGHRPDVIGPTPWDPEEFDVEDFATAYIRLDTGATLMLRTSWAVNMQADNRLSSRIVGTDAGIVTQPPAIHRIRNGQPTVETFPAHHDHNAWAHEMAHWVDVVKGNAEPLVRPEETLNVQRVLEAAYLSAEQGREVEITS